MNLRNKILMLKMNYKDIKNLKIMNLMYIKLI